MALSRRAPVGKAGAMNGTGQQPRKIHLTEQPVAVVRESVPMDSLTALYHGMPGETVDVEAGFPVAGHSPYDTLGTAGKTVSAQGAGVKGLWSLKDALVL